MNRIVFRLFILFLLLSLLVAGGTIGFVVFEGLSIAEAMYFTVVTISTVGYGDIYPLTVAGKVLSVFLIIVGVGIFLGIIADATQTLLRRREDQLRTERLHVLVGVFFSEIGNHLLRLFSDFDPHLVQIRKNSIIKENWSNEDFIRLQILLQKHRYNIDTKLLEIEPLRELLEKKGDVLLRLLENPSLGEHESFTELLRTIFHLREEITLRPDYLRLPEKDLDHLSNDSKRAYGLLAKQWVSYVRYLKESYPYLFSLALRANPFYQYNPPVIK
jgi:hypothetical protein